MIMDGKEELVLVVTDDHDISADLVIEELNQRGVRLARLDPWLPGVPATVRLGPDGTVTGMIGDVRLEDVTAVWWRRPTPFVSHLADPMAAQWCMDEHKRGLAAALWALEARWLNHPAANLACTKPAQLVAASQVGLRVADTMITNVPAAAIAFAAEEPTVTKAFHGSPNAVGDSSVMPLVWTRKADPAEIDDGVRLTGHAFQRRVRAVADIRMTVVGRRHFTAIAPTLALDWRSTDIPASFSALDSGAIPDGILYSVLDLMGHFGLGYGALDFGMDAEGRWTFYELNANGEFGFIQYPTGLSVAQAIADELTGRGRLTPTRNPAHGQFWRMGRM